MRRLTSLLITAAALLAFAPAAHAQTATPPTVCPGTFQVLHNDRIGSLSLRAGAYVITVQNATALPCAQASSLFTRFLEDFDGILPRPWIYDFAIGQFVGGTGQAFSVAYTGTGGGGGGGGGGLCPSTFQVLHNDSIGSFRLPAGPYDVTVTGLSCASASKLFAAFLQDFDGKLPSPWKLNAQTGRFTRSSTVNFRVKPATSNRGNGRSFPNGRRCGGAPFSIDATTTISGLRIRAGAYRVFVLRGSCNGQQQALGRILDLGRLPRAWTLNVQTAQFNRNGRGQFYIQQLTG